MGTGPPSSPPVSARDEEIPELEEGAVAEIAELPAGAMAGAAKAATEIPEAHAIGGAVARTVYFERSVENLPPDQRLIALLGIKKEVQLKTLPEPFRAFTVKIPRSKLTAVQEILSTLALPCSSDFIGNPDDDLVTLTYITQHPTNILHIMVALQEEDLEATINASAERTVVIRIPESRMLSLHRNLNDDATLPTESLPAHEIAPSSGARKELTFPGSMIPQAVGLDTTHATPASLDAATEATKQEFKIPREGRCVYLMIDQNFLERQSPEDPNLVKLRDEIELIRQSPNFHITGYNGYIVIIGTAERAGSSLTAMARRIFRTVPLSKIFLGIGEVQHNSGAETFGIAGFPTTDKRHAWTEANPGVYLTPEFHRRLIDPGSRDSALCQIDIIDEGRGKAVDNLVQLADFRAKVSLRIGGPDRLIGYESKLKNLVEALTDSRNRLTIIRGKAGMGKSRLIEAALKHLPEAMICSLDPSGKNTPSGGKNIPGFSLMTVAEQITAKLRENNNLWGSPEAKALFEFDHESQKIKIQRVQRSPDSVVTMCLNALKLINTGRMPLVIDDFHHGDRFSVPHITNLAERYIAESNGKVVLAMREEEIFRPQDVVRLQRAVKARCHGDSKAINDMTIEGLDFTDPELARAFAFYSLPKKLRKNKTPTNLGNWPLTLGKIAGKVPFVMKTFMDAILEDTGATLTVNPAVLKRIKKIKSLSDLDTYYRERLNHLDEKAKGILQIIALMGGSVTLPQIKTIMREVTTLLPKRDTSGIELPILDDLVKKGYLVTNPGEEQGWSLQHETIRETAAGSLPDAERIELSRKLHKHFRTDRGIHTDTKFAIAHEVASYKNAPAADDEFWAEYAEIANASLGEAARFNAFGRAYHIAETILDPDKGAKAVNEALTILENETSSPGARDALSTGIVGLGIRAIMTQAQNALHLGKLNEVRELAARVEKIHQNNPEILAGSQIRDCHLLLFQAAYFERNEAAMEKIYKEKLEKRTDLPAHELAICEMRLQFRKGEYDAVTDTYSRHHAALQQADIEHKRRWHGAPHPQMIEAMRLESVRCPFERLLADIKAGLDEDMECQPGTASLQQTRELFKIKDRLEMLLSIRKKYPLTFNPHEEIALLEQYGHVCALLGDYENALIALAETWRQADQMEVHQDAARAAKIMGDIITVQGLLLISKPDTSQAGETVERTVIDRATILKGFRKYSEGGMTSLAHIPDQTNFYHLAMRIQRIRNVGILCQSYENELDGATEADHATIKEELTPLIEMAIEDFLAINETNKEQIESGADFKWNESPEVGYYLLSYLGHVLAAARKFDIPTPDDLKEETKFPLLGNASCFAASGFSETLHDNGLGEIERKRDGFFKLANCLTQSA